MFGGKSQVHGILEFRWESLELRLSIPKIPFGIQKVHVRIPNISFGIQQISTEFKRI